MSDYFRFVVLYEYGGIYLDTDVEVYKSFDNLLNNKMFMGFIFDCLIGTAVIGSEKGNPVMLEWKEILLNDFKRKGALTVSNMWITQWFLDKYPYPLFKLNGKEQGFDSIKIYPRDYFEKECFKSNRGGIVDIFVTTPGEKEASICKGCQEDIAKKNSGLLLPRDKSAKKRILSIITRA